MELIIVRHAIAFERSASRWPDDGERPLSPRGVQRARQAAAGLKVLAPRPARVLTSPLLRARQTAALLAQVAHWPAAAVCPQLDPAAAPQGLLTLLARARHTRVAVIGHEPHVSRLLAACLCGAADGAAFRFKKMGAALVMFRGPPQSGRGRLVWLLPPRALRAARGQAQLVGA